MKIVESIYNEPEKWRVSQYRFAHKNGADVWIANGVSFVRINGAPCGLLLKIKIWIAFKWWMNNAPIEAFVGRHD